MVAEGWIVDMLHHHKGAILQAHKDEEGMFRRREAILETDMVTDRWMVDMMHHNREAILQNLRKKDMLRHQEAIMEIGILTNRFTRGIMHRRREITPPDLTEARTHLSNEATQRDLKWVWKHTESMMYHRHGARQQMDTVVHHGIHHPPTPTTIPRSPATLVGH